MRQSIIGLIIFVFAGLFINTGCGSKQTVLQSDQKGRFADAVKLYQSTCVSCHGDNLQGGIGPSLKHIGSQLTSEQIQHQIYNGGGPMPGYGQSQQGILSDQQIQELTEWLASKKG